MDETELRKWGNRQIITRLELRVPKGWDGVTVRDGWLPIINRLDLALENVDRWYHLHQAKEKFGGLRYYCSVSGHPVARKLIAEAEKEAWRTCEECGASRWWRRVKTGVTGKNEMWIRTLCRRCRRERS